MTSVVGPSALQHCRILALDGGGAKGFYTLGVLQELEGMLGTPLSAKFDLIFGTSTGAIIAALLALAHEVEGVRDLYRQHVPAIMRKRLPRAKTRELRSLAREVFGDRKFTEFKTGIGIVATNWDTDRPLIFKRSVAQAHGSKGTFEPGFGCTIADAVIASCSAYPFFKRHRVQIAGGSVVEVGDGGFCANNPSLYAIADAVMALKRERRDVRLVSLGVGSYPQPRYSIPRRCLRAVPSVRLLQKTLNVNTTSMEQLRSVLFKDVPTVRISEAYTSPEMATDLMEFDLRKLDLLYRRGRESFGKHEESLRELFSLDGE
jgi:predicted acylesterase/phospholipase RssA